MMTFMPFDDSKVDRGDKVFVNIDVSRYCPELFNDSKNGCFVVKAGWRDSFMFLRV